MRARKSTHFCRFAKSVWREQKPNTIATCWQQQCNSTKSNKENRSSAENEYHIIVEFVAERIAILPRVGVEIRSLRDCASELMLFAWSAISVKPINILMSSHKRPNVFYSLSSDAAGTTARISLETSKRERQREKIRAIFTTCYDGGTEPPRYWMKYGRVTRVRLTYHICTHMIFTLRLEWQQNVEREREKNDTKSKWFLMVLRLLGKLSSLHALMSGVPCKPHSIENRHKNYYCIQQQAVDQLPMWYAHRFSPLRSNGDEVEDREKYTETKKKRAKELIWKQVFVVSLWTVFFSFSSKNLFFLRFVFLRFCETNHILEWQRACIWAIGHEPYPKQRRKRRTKEFVRFEWSWVCWGFASLFFLAKLVSNFNNFIMVDERVKRTCFRLQSER